MPKSLILLASPAAVQARRPAHRAFLDTLYERHVLLASGPKAAGDDGILVVRDGITPQELDALLAEDLS